MAIDTEARAITVRDAIVSAINTDGGTFTGNVTGATNASPIVITVSTAHGLADGQDVTITGVGGNTAANGTFTIASASGSTFSLVGSTGNGTYTTGGTYSVTRFTAKASYLPEYRLAQLNILQVDVRILNNETDALDRGPASEDIYNLEITVQQETGGGIDRMDALVSIANRIAKLFYPNMEIASLTPPVVVVRNEHELYDVIMLRDFGVFFSRIELGLRSYVND